MQVCTFSISTEEGCKALLNKANSLGSVTGIFNLAVVLYDGLFKNQTQENFEKSFVPKAKATKLLDKFSRTMCPNLKLAWKCTFLNVTSCYYYYCSDFVVFSSVSCGRGNAGQTNYGMANSVIERTCENRKKDGLPALVVQWGAVGDVRMEHYKYFMCAEKFLIKGGVSSRNAE